MVVVSPDSGRVRIAEKWADALGGVPLAFIHKTRDPRVPNQVVANRVVGEAAGRTGADRRHDPHRRHHRRRGEATA